MGLFKKKDDYSYRKNVDWDVYYQDFNNGMPYKKLQEKLMSGGYAKGTARPDTNYGRIEDTECYNNDTVSTGKEYAEAARRSGCYM